MSETPQSSASKMNPARIGAVLLLAGTLVGIPAWRVFNDGSNQGKSANDPAKVKPFVPPVQSGVIDVQGDGAPSVVDGVSTDTSEAVREAGARAAEQIKVQDAAIQRMRDALEKNND